MYGLPSRKTIFWYDNSFYELLPSEFYSVHYILRCNNVNKCNNINEFVFQRYIPKDIIDNTNDIELKIRIQKTLNLYFKLCSIRNNENTNFIHEIEIRIFNTLSGLTTEEIKYLNRQWSRNYEKDNNMESSRTPK